jgi:hypothetical protein
MVAPLEYAGGKDATEEDGMPGTRGVDTEERGSQADITLPCESPEKPILERLDEPMPEAGEYCVHEGRPCILFSDWDYAEDWSGRFVRTLQPSLLAAAARIGAAEFWSLVRDVQNANGWRSKTTPGSGSDR